MRKTAARTRGEMMTTRDWSRVKRTTIPLPTRLRPEIVKRAIDAADRRSDKSLRAYMEALIAQGLVKGAPVSAKQTESLASAYPSSAWAIGPAVLANRAVMALDALAERIQAGEDCEALRADLMSLRWEIGQMLLALRVDYDREVEARDAKHYKRFGTVDK
jgi:hypothetical protein